MVKVLHIDKKGRIELPDEVLDLLKVKSGDRLRIRQLSTGEFVLESLHDLLDFDGALEYKGPPISIEEMNEACIEEV